MAAGLSSRYPGGHKLLERLGEATVIEHVVRVARRAGISDIVVSTGHGREQIEQVLRSSGVLTVFNSDFKSGMGSSIATGVRHAQNLDGYLIWPGDMPGISPKTVRTLIKSFATGRILVPVYEGRRGHPVLFSDVYRSELSTLSSDRGARSILDANPSHIVEVEVNDPGIHVDLDMKSDLVTLQLLSGRASSPEMRG